MKTPDIVRPHQLGGEQRLFYFSNDWSASVVKTPFSYGFEQGQWELGVKKSGKLHYDNPIAEGDVRGYLTEDEVDQLLTELEAYTKEHP